MREVIDRYADGDFDYDRGKLLFSVQKLEAAMPAGELYEGTFVLYSSDEIDFHAYIYTSDMRLICRNDEVRGRRETIHYVFDPTGLEPGDIVKGDVQIVSDAGEYYLPFVFSISFGVIESSLGSVRNLFHFANQAQANWDEAVELFYSPQFSMVFEGNDRIQRDKYRGFSQKAGNHQAVDDFLVAVNKKRPIVYSVDRSSYEFNEVTDILRCDLQLHKSTWGNVEVSLSSDVPFIQLEKEKLTGSDFVGNTHNLVFFILDEKLHEGRNFGRILIKSHTQELSVSIIARHRARVNAIRIERREKRNLTAKLMRQYVSFRMKKSNVSAWVRESMKIVERMNALDEKNPVSRLYQAQLLLTQKRDNEAGWILDHVEREMNIKAYGDAAYAYYLYLRSLLARDENYTNQISAEIRQLFEAHPGSFEILWTLLYVDEEYAGTPSRKIADIEKMFTMGIQSPVLYIEAYNYYALNPAALTKLTAFELQVFYFAAREGRLDEDIISQICYLSVRMRSYNELLYKLLAVCYNLHPSDYIVEAICTLLIKGNRTANKYFKWFEKGIEAQLRITRLYEYYMYTIPEDYEGIIPQSVFMYFGFRNEMDWHHMALMYANMIEHKKEIPDTYDNNKENVLVFAFEQIEQEHIDSNLALIYDEVVDIEMIKPAMAPHLAKIIFAVEVAVPDEYDRVILIQDQFEEEQKFEKEYGFAYPYVYSSSFMLFYEDSNMRRVPVPEEACRRLLNEGVYVSTIRNFVANNIYFSMYLCEGRKHYISVDEKNVDFCRELAESPAVSERYKRDIRMALLHYYYDNDQISTMDDFLIHLDVKILTQKDRADVVQFYVLRGMYDQAYQIISIYGVDEVLPQVCVRICNHMIDQKDWLPDTMLIKLCYYAFRKGKYDETTLKYMVDHFAGLTKELRNVWKAAKEFDVECYRLMERLIIQMLFTHTTVGERDEIFDEYLQSGSNTRVELAYLSNSAYEYFARERITDERVFSHMVHNFRLGEPLNDACKLALLKYYAEEKRNYSEKIKEMLVTFLIEFLHRNIYFTFFSAYQNAVPDLLDYMDKTVIEYRTNPNNKVVLHYILEDETNEEDEYHTEEMRNMFGGIFSREFILFFGENLQYYITEERGGKEMLTASDSISVSDTNASGNNSRYALLNDMVVSKAVSDDETLIKLMQEYVEADSFSRKVFRLR